MFGIGVSEFIVIVVIALVLFGTPVLTFVIGYTLGRKSPVSSEQVKSADTPQDQGEEPGHE